MADEKPGATSPAVAVSPPPLTRTAEPSTSPCAICGHPKVQHVPGTDGAGWCGESGGCDCGAFHPAPSTGGRS